MGSNNVSTYGKFAQIGFQEGKIQEPSNGRNSL